MLVKYDDEQTVAFPLGLYRWELETDVPDATYRIDRDARGFLNRWTISVVIDGCQTINFIPQPIDENLLDDILIPEPVFTGTCDDSQPVKNLRLQSYRTIEDAKVDYPEVTDWDWPPY